MQFKGDEEALCDSILLFGGGVGWTGSLALDLLINSFETLHLGSILSPHHLPMAGCGVFTSDKASKLTTTVEVYKLKGKNVCIIQQRGPVIKNHNELFAKELVAWSKECGVKELVFLLSVDATRRNDEQLTGVQHRACFSNSHSKETKHPWKELEKETFSVHLRPSAFPFKLLSQCNDAAVPLMIITKFCSEGNNLSDSAEVAGLFASEYLFEEGTTNVTFKAPPSWNHIQGSPLLKDVFIY